MKKAIVRLESRSPYSQSRFHGTEKLEKELADDYERRTWKEKGHFGSDGIMFVPPTAISGSLKEAAKYLSMQVPGKGKTTYTKHFEAGVLITEPLPIGYTRDTISENWVYANADGVKGSGKRVMRCFPTVHEWAGTVEYLILDEIITLPVFEKVLETAGTLIGIGQFRPRNGGYFGRYKGTITEWVD